MSNQKNNNFLSNNPSSRYNQNRSNTNSFLLNNNNQNNSPNRGKDNNMNKSSSRNGKYSSLPQQSLRASPVPSKFPPRDNNELVLSHNNNNNRNNNNNSTQNGDDQQWMGISPFKPSLNNCNNNNTLPFGSINICNDNNNNQFNNKKVNKRQNQINIQPQKSPNTSSPNQVLPRRKRRLEDLVVNSPNKRRKKCNMVIIGNNEVMYQRENIHVPWHKLTIPVNIVFGGSDQTNLEIAFPQIQKLVGVHLKPILHTLCGNPPQFQTNETRLLIDLTGNIVNDAASNGQNHQIPNQAYIHVNNFSDQYCGFEWCKMDELISTLCYTTYGNSHIRTRRKEYTSKDLSKPENCPFVTGYQNVAKSLEIQECVESGWNKVWISRKEASRKNIALYNYQNIEKSGSSLVDIYGQDKRIKLKYIPVLYTLLVWFSCKSSMIQCPQEKPNRKSKKKINKITKTIKMEEET